MKFIKNLDFMLKFIWKHNKLWLFLCALTTLLSAVTPLIKNACVMIEKEVYNETLEKQHK